MLATYTYYLAPWIVQKDNVLLGHRLSAIRVPHLNFSNIPINKLDNLIQNNFILDQKNIVNNKNSLLQEWEEKSFDMSLNWIWVSDASFLKSALLLKKYLSCSDLFGHWGITTDKNIISNSLSANPSKKPFLIRLSHQESIENEIIKNIYAGLIDETQIIWVGETTEGPHIGPIIQTYQDLEKYHVATKTWHFSQKLIEFGFKDFWPSSIYLSLISDPQKIANAILEIINASPETCFLVEENRKTCLWTTLTEIKFQNRHFSIHNFGLKD